MARTTFEYTGILSSWNDGKGYGFVDLRDGSRPLFVHINAFTDRSVRPVTGDGIRFSIEAAPDGRSRAAGVQIVPQVSSTRTSSVRSQEREPSMTSGIGSRPGARSSMVAGLFFGAIWAGIALSWGVPTWIWVQYGVMSAIALLMYWRDKRAARTGDRRVPEVTLLALGLFGGWPGAIVAQQVFRHKTTKRSFRTEFWITAVVNVCFFIVVIWAISHPEIVGG
ncbi:MULTISPECIES: DUF1294 domain-containing protein [unclassified Leifsonia]|uniref:DUF1294 domain-containing protein n=1 Tax=unclassified Leifsonia TaxID=2663824 RepID=UPI0006F9DF55|nr:MULTISPECIES: DUF1294 domain-containing protein [unclassified Leifsonia]KQX07418.1 hypothetical protein ASC59_06535 [Leifsonia sp. Root1293]KRA11700.1 hypothetical protein ASD61_06535 [Leifsonia sp. Root60]